MSEDELLQYRTNFGFRLSGDENQLNPLDLIGGALLAQRSIDPDEMWLIVLP